MKFKQPSSLVGAAAGVLAVILFAPKLSAAPVVDPEADRIFRAACKYLADAKGFTVKVEVWRDVVLPTGQKLQTTQQLEVQQQRPDRLHLEVRSPRASRGFWYQGKSLTMLDRTMNLYGVMDAPGNLDKALDTVEERFGIDIPLGDVLVADPYRNVMDSAETLEDLGRVTVLGTPCHHLAFTGANADGQVWIAEGPKPLPRKIVVNLKTVVGSPQVTQIFNDWDLVSPISDSVFTFVPPEGAGKIVVNPRKSEDEPAAASDAAPAKK